MLYVLVAGGDVLSLGLLGILRIRYQWKACDVGRRTYGAVLRVSQSFLRYVCSKIGTHAYLPYLCLVCNKMLSATSSIVGKLKSSAFRRI